MSGQASRTRDASAAAATRAPAASGPVALWACVAPVAAIVAVLTRTGSDAFWPVALGSHIRESGAVPAGVPFAAAPSSGWVNTTVLGQLVFSLIGSAGTMGLLAAQTVSVAATLSLIALDALRRGARPARAIFVIACLAVGAATAFLVARVQLLSLVPFALLLLLLRFDYERPSRRIWFVVPLLALWGNLHGAVLIGVAVTGCYLLFSRLRRDPGPAVCLGIATLAASCANPGLWRAPAYYLGVLGGEATSDASGMWGRPDLGNPFDLMMVATAVVLVVMAVRRRRPVWEYVALAGLAAGTVTASRNAVWLLLLAAGAAAASRPPAAPQTDDTAGDRRAARDLRRNTLMAGTVALLGVVVVTSVLALRAPSLRAGDDDVAAAARAASGRVVLAPEPVSEQLAASGATVWVSNPLDAFETQDQSSYLAFQRGDEVGATRALEQAEVVIAPTGSVHAAMALARGYTELEHTGPYSILVRG